jgi:MFS family permease
MLSFGLIAVYWANFGQSFFISWYGASIQQQLGLSATAYGSAYSGATLVSGLCIMAFGGLIDRIRLQTFVLIVGTGLCMGALLMWQVSSLAMLILALFMLRFFGQGLLSHTSATTMGRYFGRSRGKAMSIANTSVALGEMTLPALTVWLIALVGWQSIWLLIACTVPLVFLPLAFWLLRRAGPPESTAPTTTPDDSLKRVDGSRRTLLQDGRFWRVLPLVLAPPFIVTGVFIHQGSILAQKHWSPTLFALSFVLYGAAHWSASIITGAMVDRYSATRVIRFLGVPYIIGMLAAGLFEGNGLAFVLMAAMGIGMGMMGPIIGSIWPEIYGTRNLGSIRSLITSVSVLGTAASPIFLGWLIDSGYSVNNLLLGLGAYALLASVLSLYSYRPLAPVPG